MNTYSVKQHPAGYEVIARGADRGISTHANILDAIAAARVANRYLRSLQS
jgi:hypothetical protein